MKSGFDPEAGPKNGREEPRHPPIPEPVNQANGAHHHAPNGAPHPDNGFGFWAVLDLLMHHRWLLLLSSLSCGAFCCWLAFHLVGKKYTASARLLRYETPGLSDVFKSAFTVSPETFAGLMVSPELLRNVGATVHPPIPPEILARQIKVSSGDDADSDIVTVALAAGTPQQAVSLLSEYLTQAAAFTRELQGRQVGVAVHDYLKKEVKQMDDDIEGLQQDFRKLAAPPQVTNKLAQIGGQLSHLDRGLDSGAAPGVVDLETERLHRALGELSDLMAKYTEAYPLVQQKKSEIAAIESEISHRAAQSKPLPWAASLRPVPATEMVVSPPPVAAANPELDIVRSKLLSLETGRVELANRQREAQLLAANPPTLFNVLAEPTMSSVRESWRRLKICLLTVFGLGLGLFAGLGLATVTELADNRLKTVDDVKRVTCLPVLGSIGDLERMDAEARLNWAFRTWTMLQGHLSPSPHHGLVCGITSSSSGEGRSTWIRLLADAASLTGFRVLTIATRPEAPKEEEEPGDDPLDTELESRRLELGDSGKAIEVLAPSALSSPARVAAQLTEPNSPPVVHIPLPGWVWNLDRRKQWLDALNCWRNIENLVILVELPPASVTESVLLGSSLPNLLWLSRSGTADAAATREQLETLRHARCRLAGAIINHQSARPMKKRFPRWIAALAATTALVAEPVRAQSPAPVTPPEPAKIAEPGQVTLAPANTNLSFSVRFPWQRAAWQTNLTLGAGDVLNFGLFGEPTLDLQNVTVGPDGRVGYLEAQDVAAAGLTIDQLRERLDQELGKYRRSPRTVITPVAFRSKKYFMLGEVVGRGVYTLDRPLTLLEAVARAKGFESGLVDGKVIELADFSHSFIARNGNRIPLDLDRLFKGGDLSQNVPLEPGDYVYVAQANLQEVYVLGEVRLPGPTPYSSSPTLVRALTARGGFTERAFHGRVLVARGSLAHPELFVVNTTRILDGKDPDFRLEPGDIIYVHVKPWARAQDLADLAITGFIQGSVYSWMDTRLIKPYAQ